MSAAANLTISVKRLKLSLPFETCFVGRFICTPPFGDIAGRYYQQINHSVYFYVLQIFVQL